MLIPLKRSSFPEIKKNTDTTFKPITWYSILLKAMHRLVGELFRDEEFLP